MRKMRSKLHKPVSYFSKINRTKRIKVGKKRLLAKMSRFAKRHGIR